MVVVKTSKGFQIKLEDGRLLPKVYGSREEANRRIGQMKAHKTESDIRYSVPILECEVLERDGDKPIKAKIGGICLKPTISRNKNKYTIKNIQENDGKEVKLFIQEHGDLKVKNIVGKSKLTESDGVLRYDGEIRNTEEHPDIVEHAVLKEIEISIDARASGMSVEVKGGNKVFSYDKVDVRALCGVGIGGLAENSMDYAIAESFKDYEEKQNDQEVVNVEEVEKLNRQIAERDLKIKEQEDEIAKKDEEAKKVEDEAKKVEEAKKEEEKKKVVESIMKINKKLVEKELKEKEIPELKIIEEYEKKLSEVDEDGKDKDGEGVGEENKEEEGEPKESDKPGIVIEKDKDTISMNPKLYEQFREGIKNNL